MLSNVYFLAKFRFETAENEPAKNLQNSAKFANLLILLTLAKRRSESSEPALQPAAADAVRVRRDATADLNHELCGMACRNLQNFNFQKLKIC